MGMKPRGRRHWRWVTRRRVLTAFGETVQIWDCVERPHMTDNYWTAMGGMHAAVCAAEFKEVFGVVPEPGQCMRVEFGPALVLEAFDA